jgi:hypothetical protein
LFHLNLETSEVFLSKTKIAIQTLLSLSKDNPAVTKQNKITQLQGHFAFQDGLYRFKIIPKT